MKLAADYRMYLNPPFFFFFNVSLGFREVVADGNIYCARTIGEFYLQSNLHEKNVLSICRWREADQLGPSTLLLFFNKGRSLAMEISAL